MVETNGESAGKRHYGQTRGGEEEGVHRKYHVNTYSSHERPHITGQPFDS